MRTFRKRRFISLAALLLVGAAFLFPRSAPACNGTDVILSKDPASEAAEAYRNKDGTFTYVDGGGNLLLERSVAKIPPAVAVEIAERFLTQRLQEPPLPLTFRKLEWVHGKLVYQFKSEPLKDYNGQYHLGPVNYIEDHLVLDVDAMTGELTLGNGCGAAPGTKLADYDPRGLDPGLFDKDASLVSNNTNFIARRTGNAVKVDGLIEPGEWKDTGHKYFYIGQYKPHKPFQAHGKEMYYAEVWAQIAGGDIYFAVRTDSPNWVGIMLKGDPNLGMLTAYTDAKVLRSNGEVTDRHFVTRPDKTFFLDPDASDDILSSGALQDDLYTYEFSFPLASDDAEDIQLLEGRAYNMLFVAGNTMEHFGIFTLDDAHKEHDHSKNNDEHVNVWSSTETTLRIGEAASMDIFGATVAPVFESFESGYDAQKSDTHFHYATASVKDFNTRALMSYILLAAAVVFGIVGIAFMMLRFRATGAKFEVNGEEEGIDLFRYGWLRRFVMWKHFRAVFIVPTLLIFVAIVVLGFMDVQDGRRNIATVYTWTLWWSLIIFSFIILGRLWCMMCPFAAIGDLSQKVLSLNRKLPRWMQNMGIQTLGFIVLTLAFTLMMFDSKPFVTAVVILMILAATIIFSVIYERRSFCRHLCPIGAVIGLYSALAPLALVTKKRSDCDAHFRKTCAATCPMLEAPQDKDNNVYCNFCMKCLPACPKGNLTLKLKPLGSDLSATRRRPVSEALASLFLLGVIMVETLAMTSAWMPFKAYVGGLLGTGTGVATYLIIFTATVILPILLFYGLCHALRKWLGEGYSVRGLLSEFAFVFIPLGISLHLAHNVQHLLMEGPVAVPATLRLIDNAGLALPLILNWNPLPVVGLKPLFFIQMGIILGSLVLTLNILYRLLKRIEAPLAHLYKMSAAMSVYALVVILTSIYMLGLPMNGRHIH